MAESIPLKTGTRRKAVDSNKCIICQLDTQVLPTRGEDGVKNVIRAAHQRNDLTVLERLKHIKESEIVYHMTNDCYKQYVHPKSLSKATRKRDDSAESGEMEQETVTQDKKRTRQSTSPTTSGPSTGLSQREIEFSRKCVICNAAKKGDQRTKNRICEENRAKDFLKADSRFHSS